MRVGHPVVLSARGLVGVEDTSPKTTVRLYNLPSWIPQQSVHVRPPQRSFLWKFGAIYPNPRGNLPIVSVTKAPPT